MSNAEIAEKWASSYKYRSDDEKSPWPNIQDSVLERYFLQAVDDATAKLEAENARLREQRRKQGNNLQQLFRVLREVRDDLRCDRLVVKQLSYKQILMNTLDNVIIDFEQGRYEAATDIKAENARLQQRAIEALVKKNDLEKQKEKLTGERDRLGAQRDTLLEAACIGLDEMETWKIMRKCDCPASGCICGLKRLTESIRLVKTAIRECEVDNG